MSLLRGAKITWTRPGPDRIAEIREPETDELVDHMWVPGPDETIELSDYVVTIELRPEDTDQ